MLAAVCLAHQHAASMQVNVTLEELLLETNQVDDEAVEHLAKMLAVNKTLRVVNLGANRIGDSGAAALAEMLKANTTLRELNLGSNEIGYDGARHASMVTYMHEYPAACHLTQHGRRVPSHGASYRAASVRRCGVAVGPCCVLRWRVPGCRCGVPGTRAHRELDAAKAGCVGQLCGRPGRGRARDGHRPQHRTYRPPLQGLRARRLCPRAPLRRPGRAPPLP